MLGFLASGGKVRKGSLVILLVKFMMRARRAPGFGCAGDALDAPTPSITEQPLRHRGQSGFGGDAKVDVNSPRGCFAHFALLFCFP